MDVKFACGAASGVDERADEFIAIGAAAGDPHRAAKASRPLVLLSAMVETLVEKDE